MASGGCEISGKDQMRIRRIKEGKECNMYGKRMKSVITCLLIPVMILCYVGCASEPEEQEKVTEIIIPQSYLTFVDAGAEDTAQSYREYCMDSEVKNADVVLRVTESQKEDIFQMNQDYIDKTLKKFTDENPEYSYQLSEDYSSIVYTYDENIDEFLQTQLLMGVTSMYALNGIIDNNTADWSVEITIKNCHTNKIVAQGKLPKDTLSFGEDEWKESYEN